MRKLSEILEENRRNSAINKINDKNSLSRYIKENLNSSLVKFDIQVDNEKQLDRIKDKLKNLGNQVILSDPKIDQQHIKPLNSDENLKDFIFALDCINAFKKMCDYYIQYKNDNNKEISWFDNQVIKAIDDTYGFVEQIAALVTYDHQDIEIELNIDVDEEFGNNKQLASIIKKYPEFKLFRKIIKRKHNFSNQKLDVRSLCLITLEKSKKLLQII